MLLYFFISFAILVWVDNRNFDQALRDSKFLAWAERRFSHDCAMPILIIKKVLIYSAIAFLICFTFWEILGIL